MGRTPSYCFTVPGAEDSQDGLEGEARHGLRGLRATFGILIPSTLVWSLAPPINDLSRSQWRFHTTKPLLDFLLALTADFLEELVFKREMFTAHGTGGA